VEFIAQKTHVFPIYIVVKRSECCNFIALMPKSHLFRDWYAFFIFPSQRFNIMKYKNYTKSKYILLVIAALLFSSCVSNRKYQAAVSENARLKSDSTVQANEVASLEYKLSNQLITKEHALDEKNKRIDSLMKFSNIQKHQLEKILNNLKGAFPHFSNENIDTYIDHGFLHVSLDHRILFNQGENDISPEGVMVVESISKELQPFSSDIMILGHTDTIPYYGSGKDNWQLSFERAHSVMEIMVDSGIPSERIIIAGRGKNEPFIKNKTQIGRLLNRRIEVVLMPDMGQVENIFTEFIE
jgi:chemotaxis protein MotB